MHLFDWLNLFDTTATGSWEKLRNEFILHMGWNRNAFAHLL